MYKEENMYKYVALCTVVLVGMSCARWSRIVSILESSPYIGYDTYVLPEPIDGPQSVVLGLSGNFTNTLTDADTTVTTTAGSIAIHYAWSSFFENGAAFTSTYGDDELFGHGVVDFKFNLARLPVVASPYIGFGAGMGQEAWSFDTRVALILGYELAKEHLVIYIAPRYINYLYPWYVEGDEWGADTWKYDIAPIFGGSAGFSFSVNLGPGKKSQKLKIRPEVTYLWGSEPQAGRIDFNVFQVGVQFGIAF
jgi:hypothetical protein